MINPGSLECLQAEGLETHRTTGLETGAIITRIAAQLAMGQGFAGASAWVHVSEPLRNATP